MLSARFADGASPIISLITRDLTVRVHVDGPDPASTDNDFAALACRRGLHTGGRRTSKPAAHDHHSRHRTRRIPDKAPTGQHLLILSDDAPHHTRSHPHGVTRQRRRNRARRSLTFPGALAVCSSLS
jgi:hypothetical protein